jgi:hypothetical protein
MRTKIGHKAPATLLAFVLAATVMASETTTAVAGRSATSRQSRSTCLVDGGDHQSWALRENSRLAIT